MKTSLFLPSLLILLSINVYAQLPAYKHSVGLGIEHVGLDAPDGVGARYLGRYALHLFKDRLTVEAGLGYMSALNRHYFVDDIFIDGKRRKRVTGDLTFAFDFLRTPRHAFRIGVGPSLWYRKDKLVGRTVFSIRSDGTVINPRVLSWYQVEQINYGFNVLIEYEYAFTQHFTLAPRVSFVSLERAGQSSIYGLNLGYRLLK